MNPTPEQSCSNLSSCWTAWDVKEPGKSVSVAPQPSVEVPPAPPAPPAPSATCPEPAAAHCALAMLADACANEGSVAEAASPIRPTPLRLASSARIWRPVPTRPVHAGITQRQQPQTAAGRGRSSAARPTAALLGSSTTTTTTTPNITITITPAQHRQDNQQLLFQPFSAYQQLPGTLASAAVGQAADAAPSCKRSRNSSSSWSPVPHLQPAQHSESSECSQLSIATMQGGGFSPMLISSKPAVLMPHAYPAIPSIPLPCAPTPIPSLAVVQPVLLSRKRQRGADSACDRVQHRALPQQPVACRSCVRQGRLHSSARPHVAFTWALADALADNTQQLHEARRFLSLF